MNRPPVAHIEALRERLERDGKVTFKSGATVWIERRVVVRSAGNAVVVYREDEIERAYSLAKRPLEPLRDVDRPDDADLNRRFGADPPF